uniref:Pyrroline-5-carboxylate reductase catalytic N-terminal domain-containing protein n=1 Tax=Lotharella globosa TaxID=91324 RepID=A0A7S3YJZ1_9EUKA
MPRVGFIGAGQMATAMARGIVKSKLYPAADIIASDRSKEQRESFAKLVGCSTTEDNKAVAKGSETLILAVKPNIVPYVLAEVKGCLTSSTLVVSIAAGVSLATMEELLPTGTRLARVMPNTPCLVGETASAYALGKNATKDDGTPPLTRTSATPLSRAHRLPRQNGRADPPGVRKDMPSARKAPGRRDWLERKWTCIRLHLD